MTIDLVAQPGTTLTPQAQSALNYAAQYLGSLIHDPATVTIGVNMVNAGANGDLATGGPSAYLPMSLSEVSHYIAAADPSIASSIPTSLPSGVYGEMFVTPSEAKAWGVNIPSGSSIDGVVNFNTHYASIESYATGTNTTSNLSVTPVNFVGVALHELTHALGRVTANVQQTNGQYIFDPLNLFRFIAPGTLEVSGANYGFGHFSTATPYFSTDNGTTSIDSFAGPSHGDWQGNTDPTDPFDIMSGPSNTPTLTAADKSILGAIGFAMQAPATTTTTPVITTPAITVDLPSAASTVLGSGNFDINMADSNAVTVGGGSNDSITAQTGSDTIEATGNASVFAYTQSGYAGKISFINNGTAAATVIDNQGSDTIYGGAGGGTLTGGTGGNNSIIGGTGAIFATGGGNNSIIVANSAQDNYLFAGFGNETLIATSGTGTNLFDANPGSGGDVMQSDGSGTQYFFGSAGSSTVTGSTVAGASNIFFEGSTVLGGASVVVTNFGQINGAIDANNGVTVQQVADTIYAGKSGALVTLTDGTRVTLLGVQASSLSYTVGGNSIT